MTTGRGPDPGGAVRVERHGDVLVLVIDNPPVNASSVAVRAGLLAGIAQVAGSADIVGAVLIGARDSFVAGSDIREFSGRVAEPLLPAVIAAIERCPKPVVAALDGLALGGGLELALGCDLRIATPRCRVGLPEVTLGMVPGAGGTQRLPRLIGRIAAMDLIVSGRRIDGPSAHKLGLVDEVVEPAELLDRAVAAARGVGKRPVGRLPVPDEDAPLIPATVAAALKTGRQRPQAVAAIRLVQLAGVRPVDEALVEERRVFDDLRTRPEASALRHLFFAERAASKVDGLGGVRALPVQRVGVVGAGTMGVGIATAMVIAGYHVTLTDLDAGVLADGLARVRDQLRGAANRGKLPSVAAGTTGMVDATGVADVAARRLHSCAAIEDLRDADLVVEAVFEDIDAKTSVLRRLDGVLAADAIVASNTSYLDLDELASRTSRPASVVGLHFFNPAHVMRLVEVVRGAATSPQVLRTALDVAKRLGKAPIVAGVGEGFIGNRGYAAYRRQCEFMLEEGALPEEVDRALVDFGFAMGPFAVADLSGLDIAWAMRRRRVPQRDPRERYVEIPDILCEAGRFGRKSGAGYFAYPAGGGPGMPDPEVRRIIEEHSAAKGIRRHQLAPGEIVDRAVFALVNEAALILDEGIAQSPGDIDVAFALGYGFPRHEGGPLWWAAQQPAARVAAGLARLAETTGYGFRAGPVDEVLRMIRAR